MAASSKSKKTVSVSTVNASQPATPPGATTSTPAAAPATSPKLPPATANIPAPPQGFVPTNGTDYRGLLPRKTELAVLPDAVAELQRFTSFAQTFGKTMPPLATVLGFLNAAEQWSSMRAKSSEWDLYCRTQEGLAWKDARDLMSSSMRPAFTMAVSTDASIASDNPSIARLLEANSTIAKRGAATRKANRQSKQEGKAPVAGEAATKEKEVAKEVAKAEAGGTNPAAPASSSPAATTASAPAPAVAATNGVGNGAGH